jgi:integrase
VKLPDKSKQLPKGIEIHGNQLRISFMLGGKRYREPVPNISKITKSTIAYAAQKRNVVMTEIKEGRFDYATHFPSSRNAALFSGWGGPDMARMVAAGIDRYLEVKEAKLAEITFRNYKVKANHVKAKWAHRRIADVTQSEIELFQAELLRSGLAPKTVNDIFTTVRGVWAHAFSDGVIRTNPLDRIKNLESDENDNHADPFTLKELERIQSVKSIRQQDINLVMFACWCGLSVSELLALSWDDVDTENWVIYVKRAVVEGTFKVPKEKARIRRVDLVEPARQWLQRQRESTYLQPPMIISVIQRDNITTRDDTFRPVFRNGLSNQPWSYVSLHRWFTGHLRRANVRHRGPNQCRHTFASQMLSNYVSLEWVARQLGHKDTTMVKKHYGTWIPEDTPNMAENVSAMLGPRTDRNGLENCAFAPIQPQK